MLNRIALASASAILFASAAIAAPGGRPLVLAHRGGALLRPENTFPAFDNAVRLGADMLEFDMQLTADDQLVISHDATIDGSFCTADPGSGLTPGPVRMMTLSDVQHFDCGSKHRAIYPGQIASPGARMPTLDAFFVRYKDTPALFFGEIKMPGPNEGTIDPITFTNLVARAVRKHGLRDRFILQSSDYRTIDAMHRIDPRIRTCLLKPWDVSTDFMGLVRQHHAKCILLRLQDADAAQVKRLREAGMMVVSEVIDTEKDWRGYLARGADALFTNDPASLIDFLNREPESH